MILIGVSERDMRNSCITFSMFSIIPTYEIKEKKGEENKDLFIVSFLSLLRLTFPLFSCFCFIPHFLMERQDPSE